MVAWYFCVRCDEVVDEFEKGFKDDHLCEGCRAPSMTDEQREAQRISFAYGNAKLANPEITREMVIEQAKLLKE